MESTRRSDAAAICFPRRCKHIIASSGGGGRLHANRAVGAKGGLFIIRERKEKATAASRKANFDPAAAYNNQGIGNDAKLCAF